VFVEIDQIRSDWIDCGHVVSGRRNDNHMQVSGSTLQLTHDGHPLHYLMIDHLVGTPSPSWKRTQVFSLIYSTTTR
jgi:hypothetical protein